MCRGINRLSPESATTTTTHRSSTELLQFHLPPALLPLPDSVRAALLNQVQCSAWLPDGRILLPLSLQIDRGMRLRARASASPTNRRST